jgi:hypothetical protein
VVVVEVVDEGFSSYHELDVPAALSDDLGQTGACVH